MKISKVLDYLRLQLSNVYISDENDAAQKKKLLMWLNLAVIDISSKLHLNRKNYILKIVEQNKYQLPLDSMTVINITTMHGNVLPLNRDDSNISLYTNGKELWIPDIYKVGAELNILYSATIEDILDESNAVLPINDQYINLIMLYINWRVHKVIDDTSRLEQSAKFAEYQNELKTLEMNGLIQHDSISNSKFNQKGFV